MIRSITKYYGGLRSITYDTSLHILPVNKDLYKNKNNRIWRPGNGCDGPAASTKEDTEYGET